MRYFVGVDNGLNGGIAVIDENENIIYKYAMPTIQGTKKDFNIQEIARTIHAIKNLGEVIFFLEEARVQPISGKRASFTTGLCYGLFQGMFASLDIPYEIVAPKVWQKELLKGLATDTKVASIMFCTRKYPNEDWTATEKSRKPHDGLTDSTCIAIYGKRIMGDNK